jgi:oxygen-dependent protoporphyrinogen oxidase
VCLPSAVPLKFIQSRYSSSSASYPNRIAIVGGGISGLASAHFIAKEFPKSKITLYESQNRLGGWLRSERHKVTGGDVLFEYGPRTLRPGALVTPTLQLVCLVPLSIRDMFGFGLWLT